MIYVSYLVGVAPKHCFYRIFQRWGRPPLKKKYPLQELSPGEVGLLGEDWPLTWVWWDSECIFIDEPFFLFLDKLPFLASFCIFSWIFDVNKISMNQTNCWKEIGSPWVRFLPAFQGGFHTPPLPFSDSFSQVVWRSRPLAVILHVGGGEWGEGGGTLGMLGCFFFYGKFGPVFWVPFWSVSSEKNIRRASFDSEVFFHSEVKFQPEHSRLMKFFWGGGGRWTRMWVFFWNLTIVAHQSSRLWGLLESLELDGLDIA